MDKQDVLFGFTQIFFKNDDLFKRSRNKETINRGPIFISKIVRVKICFSGASFYFCDCFHFIFSSLLLLGFGMMRPRDALQTVLCVCNKSQDQ